MEDQGQIIFNRLDIAYRRWTGDEIDIKGLLGYQDDKEFNIVNMKERSGIIEYYTSDGKVTFQVNKQLIEDGVIPWGDWCWSWRQFIHWSREYEDYLND